jgi:hypothetical protein
MIKKILISTLLSLPVLVNGQYKIQELIPHIIFEDLDSLNWSVVDDHLPVQGTKGVLAFKHSPILDSLGRPIEPIIAIVFEEIPDSIDIDVIEYSVPRIGTKPWGFKNDLLGGYPEYSSDINSVFFKGEYTREGVDHVVRLGYIIDDLFGLEIIADATEEVFPYVESDIASFMKSVRLNENAR